jgi:hypothetical protein
VGHRFLLVHGGVGPSQDLPHGFARLSFHQADGCVHVHLGRVCAELNRIFAKNPSSQAFHVASCIPHPSRFQLSRDETEVLKNEQVATPLRLLPQPRQSSLSAIQTSIFSAISHQTLALFIGWSKGRSGI